MPIYEYRCERGHNFEVLQRMTEDPLTVCEEHGTPVHRVFHPVAVHFKGSGFYNTDYGKKKKGGASSDGKGDSDSSSTTTTGGDYKKKDAGSGSKDSGSSSTAKGSSSSSD
ncbi:MAG TPA: FmdB family zinc ribbon protein [Thermoleophilaceae bacterium]|jgi:putative FmdB family regulatory protein